MSAILSAVAWEAMYAPYDQPTYQAVLDQLKPDDVVLDIGAGDLRLTRQMARMVRKVYAVEIDASVLDQVSASRDPLPGNLTSVCADARALDFPSDLTAGVLMMRHCTHFHLYFEKLRNVGALRLITNARWHMHMEVVDLRVRRKSFADADPGWYACLCGAAGFKEGSAEHWLSEMDTDTNEVSNCPKCMER
ncbi:MAG: rRNA adenine N-6-methyltransferase family protein [Chloroflexota bacterium]